MKKTTKALLLMAAISMSSLSQAQLGGMLKKAATKAAENVATGKSPAAGTSAAVGGSSPALDWSQYPMTPAITMKSLLDGTEVSDNGNLRMNFYRATFIPNKKASGGNVDMIYDKNVLTTKVYANGQLIKSPTYGDGSYFNDGKQNTYQDNGNQQSDLMLTQEGKYKIDFFAGGKQIYTFDFDVHKKADTDPYAASSVLWYSTGPWEKWAYVTPQSTGNFIFGFYLMHTDFKPDPNNARKTTKSIVWYPELMQNGKTISVPNKQTAIVEKGEWKDFSCSMKLVGAKDFLKIAELKDGSYTMKVTVDGEAAPRMYDFKVAGGAIVLCDKQDRAKNKDPQTLVEGWNNYFWLEKK
ncbi:MAG: hypothetical protein JST78_11735 [Bacteroidetes bacterium]|nr:hypothetical protein [Bacteroidota bacterium]